MAVPPLPTGARLARLALIAIVLLLAVGGFAYKAGWLGPHGLTATRMVEVLQAGGGDHPGFRRNHSKGICVAGTFEGNGKGSLLSSSEFLMAQSAQVVGRLAIAGGNPFAADDSTPVRSMALQMKLPDGQEWRTGINDIPGFPVATPEAFNDLNMAQGPDPATGKPDPKAMEAFKAAHPEFLAFVKRLTAGPRSSGFADDTYNSVNAFVFVARDGSRHLVRWSMEPETAFAPLDAAAPKGHDFLFDDLLASLDKGPLRWHLIVSVAEPGDTEDASVPWPADRERIDVGTLTLSSASSETKGGCRDIVYDPLVLPRGIEASNDPLLSARSATYAVSYRLRAGEPHTDSAVHDRKAGVAP